MLWFDLSPVRPWEWGEIDAGAWMEAVQARTAYMAGVEDASEEAEMSQALREAVNVAQAG